MLQNNFFILFFFFIIVVFHSINVLSLISFLNIIIPCFLHIHFIQDEYLDNNMDKIAKKKLVGITSIIAI